MAMVPVSKDPLAALAERQSWITPGTEDLVQQKIKDAFKPLGAAAGFARAALHGTWLHEPLHAVLVEVPVGAWTGTVVFDSLGMLVKSETLENAADATLVLGLAGAAGASITGLNDWAEVKEAAPRRIGSIHALLNIGATALFAASWVARALKKRSTGKGLALAGYALVSASAHLGGNMVYEHGLFVGPGANDTFAGSK